jgi:hypothetical protein
MLPGTIVCFFMTEEMLTLEIAESIDHDLGTFSVKNLQNPLMSFNANDSESSDLLWVTQPLKQRSLKFGVEYSAHDRIISLSSSFHPGSDLTPGQQ